MYFGCLDLFGVSGLVFCVSGLVFGCLDLYSGYCILLPQVSVKGLPLALLAFFGSR